MNNIKTAKQMKINNEYAKLLATPEWKAKRDSVLKLRNYTCQRCSSQTKLHVHHTYYDLDKKPWEYDDESLLVLCKSCHFREHMTEGLSSRRITTSAFDISNMIPFSEHVLFANSRTINSKGSNDNMYISTMSKIVYLFILQYVMAFPKRTPSYNYMLSRYGINHGTYSKAIKELSGAGIITSTIIKKRDINLLSIKIMVGDKHISYGVPKHIIETDVYTNIQKAFIAILIGIHTGEDDEYIYIKRSLSNICVNIKEFGFSKPSVIKAIRELSDIKYGYVTIMQRHKKGYSISKEAIQAIADRVNNRWNDLDLDSPYNYPIYTKPKPHDFQLLEVDGKLTIVSNK